MKPSCMLYNHYSTYKMIYLYFLGLSIYFGYGMWHSKEERQIRFCHKLPLNEDSDDDGYSSKRD